MHVVKVIVTYKSGRPHLYQGKQELPVKPLGHSWRPSDVEQQVVQDL